MKLSISDIPPEWSEPLRQKALAAGYKSVQDYLRHVIADLIQVDYTTKRWGGKHEPQVAQEEQVAALDADDDIATPAPKRLPGGTADVSKAVKSPRPTFEVTVGDDSDDEISYEDVEE